jgi:hypothetical protein
MSVRLPVLPRRRLGWMPPPSQPPQAPSLLTSGVVPPEEKV